MSEPGVADFRRLCSRLSLAATGVFAAIVAFMGVMLVILALRLNGIGERRLWLLVLIVAPIGFHLWALWSLRGLFAGLARHGLVFGRGSGVALSRTGWGLLVGGVTTLAAAPLIIRLVPPAGAVGFAVSGLSAIILCVVGAALIVLTSLLRQGLVIQEERAALRSTLDEFF